MRGRLTRSNFQMNDSTSASLPIRWGSRRLNTRVIAREAQYSFERSSQITRVARGSRISKVASAKLPSLIHSSPACACFNKARNAGTLFSSECACHMASRQIRGAPVHSPSCRANVVFPLPAQPKMTIRTMLIAYRTIFVDSSARSFQLANCQRRLRGLWRHGRTVRYKSVRKMGISEGNASSTETRESVLRFRRRCRAPRRGCCLCGRE